MPSLTIAGMRNIKFSDVAIGHEFTFYGQTFRKVAVNTAQDAEHICHLFLPETEVEIETGEFATELNARGN